MDGLHHLCAQHLLTAPNQILEKVDGDVVVGRQVDADVGCKEVVDFALAAVLSCELLRRDVRCRWLATVHWLHGLVVAIHLTVFRCCAKNNY